MRTPRLAVLDGVVPVALCQELLLLARSLAVVGYRPGVCSSTIFEVAAAAPALLPPLVAAREAVRAAVEEALGLPLGLLVEFTGLICWRPGSSIGWHHDANRPYLQQRTHSAVCYLNTAGSDFQGGTFQFQQQEESGAAASVISVQAAPGRVVAYDAGDAHRVLPVASGERFSLALWFTEDPSHSEDTRLLAQLAGPVERPLCAQGLPPTMWQLPDGTDLRLCRLAMAGFALVCQGRLLHSTTELAGGEGGEAGRLQLAVQPAVLRVWLGWHHEQAAAAEAGEGEGGAAGGGSSSVSNAQCSSADNAQAATAAVLAAGGPGLAAAALVKGVEFDGLQEAVLCVQRWAWQRCPGGWGRERVCCAHLTEAPAGKSSPAPACTWLRSCQLDSSCEAAVELCRVQAALTASRAHLASHQAALAAMHPRWLQLGAIFCDPNPV